MLADVRATNRGCAGRKSSEDLMKLYTTLTSPYGRIARMVIIAKGLQERVPVEVAKTRQADSPYYEINPSGRVPFLLRDDGPGLEESALVSRYLDELDGAPTLHAPSGAAGLEARRIEAVARSMLDGVSLWGREFLYRPPELHSGWRCAERTFEYGANYAGSNRVQARGQAAGF
jgi:glutathione S-transferase